MTTIVKANNDLVEQQKADKAEVEQKQAENKNNKNKSLLTKQHWKAKKVS